MEKMGDFHTLPISGDLGLSAINFPKSSKNPSAPDELNDYLRSQLNHMRKENESLQEQLSVKNLELQQYQTKVGQLSQKMKDLEGCCSGEFTTSSQLACNKIVELSRKLREKKSEVEVYKSKCSKLENSLSELQQYAESEQQQSDKEEKCVSEPVNQLKRLQDKLTYTTNKWIEEKNQSLKLKNDLKRANKWLQQEVGEKFENLLTLSNSGSNWRGRAQIICDLQQKNMELKEKLRAYEDKSGTNTEILAPKCDKKLEVLSAENLEMRNSYDDLKRKFDATKARCKVLESECSTMKSKLVSLNYNYENDQKTIARLKSQVSLHNEQKSEEMRQKEQTIKELQEENEKLKIELLREKCLLENKSKELMEKDSNIEILNKRIRSARPPSSYNHKHENPDTKVINRLEVERLRLLELTEVQNKRLEEERSTHLKTQHLLRIEKQKGAKLEANLARLQLEENSSKSGYLSKMHEMNKQKQNESDIRDKLELAEENIKALTTRLQIEIYERSNDIQKFSKILKDCDYK